MKRVKCFLGKSWGAAKAILKTMNSNFLQTVFRIDSAAVKWPASFAVVTSYNPYNPNGILCSAKENQKFDEEFQADLTRNGILFFRVTGGSPDFKHAEPGFAVEVSLEKALELANQWQQEAIFWIEDGSLFIISNDGRERIQLGTWASRQVVSLRA